jgi:hypothetical protein
VQLETNIVSVVPKKEKHDDMVSELAEAPITNNTELLTAFGAEMHPHEIPNHQIY